MGGLKASAQDYWSTNSHIDAKVLLTFDYLRVVSWFALDMGYV